MSEIKECRKAYQVLYKRAAILAQHPLKYEIDPAIVEQTKKFIADNPSVRDGAA